MLGTRSVFAGCTTKLGMNKRKRKWKRRPNPNKEVLLQPLASNLCWSADFMQDRIENGVKMCV